MFPSPLIILITFDTKTFLDEKDSDFVIKLII